MFIYCRGLLKVYVALRVKWAKAKARADRWEEEVILLDEEMHHVLEYCKWKEAWWMQQVGARKDILPQLEEGLCAYAAEQADMEGRIRLSWGTKWGAVRELAQPIIQAAMRTVMPEAPPISVV